MDYQALQAASAAAANNQWTPEAIQQALQVLGIQQAQQHILPTPQQLVAQQQALYQQHQQPTPQTVRPQTWGVSNSAVQAQELEGVMRRNAALHARKQDEVVIREQHKAALVVKKMIQRLRMARLDNFEELKQELEQVQQQQMHAMGPMVDKVFQEAEKAIIDVQQKMSEEGDKLAELERKQLEAQMKVREEESRVETMGEEAAMEVTEVERKVQHAEDLGSVLPNFGKDPESSEALYDAAVVADESITSAQDELNLVAAAMKDKWSGFSKKPALLQKLGPQFRLLNARMAACRRKLAKVQQSTKAIKDSIGKGVVALKKEKESKQVFQIYDADGDGKLSRQEILTYAKMEHKLDLSPKQIESICSKIAGGVTLLKLPQLIKLLAAEKQLLQEGLNRAEEEKRKKVMAGKMAGFFTVIASASKMLEEAEAAEDDATTIARPLLNRTAEPVAGQRLAQLAAEAEQPVATANEKLEKALARIAEIDAMVKADEGGKDMIATKKAELLKLRSRARRVQEKLTKVSVAASEAREAVSRKVFTDLQNLRESVVLESYKRMHAESLSVDQLYAQLCGDAGDNGIQREQFITFVTPSCSELDLEYAQASCLFEHVAEDGISIDRKGFGEFLILYFKVVRNTMLTAEKGINSKVEGRLAADEILQLLEGPVKDTTVGVTRIRCRSDARSCEGWATISGNKGATFLKPCGFYFYCVTAAALTNVVATQGSKKLRNLDAGEIIEAMGPEVWDASCKVTRMRGKAQSDGMLGWVTIAGSNGENVFLKQC